MLFKPDWEETKERYRAWWAHAYFGRCALGVEAPKEHPPALPAPPAAASVEQQWYDLDLISRRQHHLMSRTFYGGEALPVWNGGYPGNACLPTFLGCPLRLDMETGWSDPILKDEALDCSGLRIDTASRNYRFALALLERGVRESQGRSLVTVGAFGASGDTLAGLRGTDRLLFDCADRPGQVQQAETVCMDLWIAYYETVYALTRAANEGSVCWFGIWAPGRHYAAQNDFSYMISPRMFRELFLPVIDRQTRHLDYTVYHVDGKGAFAHVDALCELPRLQAIQILPGAGQPSPLHFLPVLRKVQAAGKNLHISIPSQEVPEALANLSARGLFIQTWCDSETQARALLKDAEKLSVENRP